MHNNKRYWLRGGILGIALELIVLVLSGISFILCFRGFGEIPSYCSLIDFFNWPEYYLFFFHSTFLNLVFYPAAGLIIGWIYGKIKNRNKV